MVFRRFSESESRYVSSQLESQAHETNEFVVELSASMGELLQFLQRGRGTVLTAVETSEEGALQMTRMSEQTKEIDEKTEEMTRLIHELNQSSSEIYSVVEIVKDIAGKTNLLALNSAIEAARAGENGKGFSVVAGEVGKLADQTKNSVEKIAELIKWSGEVTMKVVTAIEQIQSLSSKSMEQSEQTTATFEKISTTVEQTISDFEHVSMDLDGCVPIIKRIGESTERLEIAALNLEESINKL